MPAISAPNRLLGNALWLALGGLVAQVAFVTVEALIARRIGVEAYGVFAAVYAYALLLVHVLDLGMNWKMLEEGSRDSATLADNFGTLLLAKAGFFLVAYPLALGLLRVSGAPAVIVNTFAVFAVFSLCMMIQDVFATVFAALQRMALNAVFQAAVPVAMLFCVVAMATSHPTLLRATVACVLGTLLVTAVWSGATVRVIRPTVSPRRIPSILRDSFHYGVSVTVHALYFRLGVLTLTVLRSASEVALFAAAYKLLELGFKIPTLATRVVAPKLFGDAAHRRAQHSLHAALVLRGTAVAAGLMGLVLFLAGPAVITATFGAAFASSGPLVRILSVSLSLKAVALLAHTVLSTVDDHLYRSRADLATVLVGVVLVTALTAGFGATGTAIAVALGDLVWATLMLKRSLRYVADGPGIVLLPLAAAAIACGVSLALPVGSVIATLVAIALFGAWLLLSGHLRPVVESVMQALPDRRAGQSP